MKKKIAILGSTGSIGKSLLKIINKNKQKFEIVLLTANKNYKELLKQAKKNNVKNIIIKNQKSYDKLNKINKNKNFKIFNNFNNFEKIFEKKIDYVMSSIVGIEGLEPTVNIIKYTKSIAIANKESIICGWNLIKKNLIKHRTSFIPVDSEHFSIWYALKNVNISKIKKIYLTASGGPLLNAPKTKFNNIKINDVLKHPNWKMGQKISVDSSNMINKIFEIIEARNLFNLSLKKLSILIHPKSYIHAILIFNDGMIKIIAHDTTMEIPIFNSLYPINEEYHKNLKLNLKTLNELKLQKINSKQFPSIDFLKFFPDKISLFDTVFVSANDILVKSYLKKELKYKDIIKRLKKILQMKEFIKLKKISPKKISEIIKLDEYVRLKINTKSV